MTFSTYFGEWEMIFKLLNPAMISLSMVKLIEDSGCIEDIERSEGQEVRMKHRFKFDSQNVKIHLQSVLSDGVIK